LCDDYQKGDVAFEAGNPPVTTIYIAYHRSSEETMEVDSSSMKVPI
jgi:hypothetical protein